MLYVAGELSILSLYSLNSSQSTQQQDDMLNSLTQYITSVNVTEVLKKSFSLVMWGSSSRLSTSSDSSNQQVEDNATLNSHARPCASILSFDDSKRRILRLSLDPLHRLLCTADSLGRVILFDTSLNCSVRMWKGYRDARFAWILRAPKQVQPKTKSQQEQHLLLALYGPQIGYIQIFALRHGPLLQSIACGPQCHIYTQIKTAVEGLYV
jgi:hypothetical protein